MRTLQFFVEITDIDEKILKHNLPGDDLNKWVNAAIVGKINHIKKGLLREAQTAIFSDTNIEFIPATEEGLLNAYFSKLETEKTNDQ